MLSEKNDGKMQKSSFVEAGRGNIDAFNDWKQSPEGQYCFNIEALNGLPESTKLQYIQYRLETAFLAGARASKGDL